jgi:hypothetical protein
MRNLLVAMSILTILATLTVALITTNVNADPDTGNNGQCRQVQKLLPEWLQDYPGCHDTFTGPGHNEPPPLP